MQQKELTVKQIFLNSLSSFLSSRGKILVTLLIILFLIIIGIAVYTEINSSIVEKSTILIEEMEEKYTSEFSKFTENDDDQKKIEKKEMMENIISSLDDIIKKYSNYYAGQRALYLKGEIYFSDNQYEKALENYSIIINKYKKSYLAPISLNNIAVCHEELGDKDLAIENYKKLVELYSNDFPDISHVLFSIGRLYELKEDFKNALEYYSMLGDKYADSDWTVFSKNRIIYLKGEGKI